MSETLYQELTRTIREMLPNVELLADNHNHGGYYTIVKSSGKTVGYVNGKRKLRIDSPDTNRRVLIVHPFQIPVAIEFLQSYVKEAAT